jgi:hypothetical protein
LVLGFLFALTLALPASGQEMRLQLDASVMADVRSMSSTEPAVNPPSGEWIGGAAAVGVTVFHRRIVDDDAPPPLQPFLQRVARFHLDAGGGGASVVYPFRTFSPQEPATFLVPYRSSIDQFRVAARADGYVWRGLYLGAGFGVDYATWRPAGEFTIDGFSPSPSLPHLASSELSLNASVSAGLRWRDVLVVAGWSVSPYRIGADRMTVRFWGSAFVAGHIVVRRFIDLALRAGVLEAGAEADASVTVWLRRRVGVGLGVHGGHGAYVDSPVIYDRAGGRATIAWWIGPRIAASLSYAPVWQRTTAVAGLGTAITNFSSVAHVLALTVSSRPPSLGVKR